MIVVCEMYWRVMLSEDALGLVLVGVRVVDS